VNNFASYGGTPITDDAKIREYLRRKRLELGLTQAEVAERVGYSKTAYCNLETGSTEILNKIFVKLPEALGVSIEELLLGFEPDDPGKNIVEDVRSEYGQKMRMMRDGFQGELSRLNEEIRHLKEQIHDKEETISAQKVHIKDLQKQLKAKK
jgi:transcriptional regulator with XRE-family HTH domain